MKKAEKFKRANSEEEIFINDVVQDLIEYIKDGDYEGLPSIDEIKDIIEDILTCNLCIEEDVSDEEFKEIVKEIVEEIFNKVYQLFVDKFNKFRIDSRKYEESLFQNRDNIMEELQDWFENHNFECLTLNEVIDLIIKNGNS